MKLIVTGALGHIGSRIIRELPVLFPGVEIVMIDNMVTQRYPSLFDLPTNGLYTFVEGDILTLDLDSLFSEADAVIHLAAITDATSSFDNQEKVQHNNYTTSLRVSESCVTSNVNMFLISSTSVYGTQEKQVDENCRCEELKPQSPYAETKLKEEALIKDKIEINADDKKLIDDLSRNVIKDFIAEYEKISTLSRETLEPVIKSLITKHKTNFKGVGQPLRIALTGSKFGPGIYDIIISLGKDDVEKRLSLSLIHI